MILNYCVKIHQYFCFHANRMLLMIFFGKFLAETGYARHTMANSVSYTKWVGNPTTLE